MLSYLNNFKRKTKLPQRICILAFNDSDDNDDNDDDNDDDDNDNDNDDDNDDDDDDDVYSEELPHM